MALSEWLDEQFEDLEAEVEESVSKERVDRLADRVADLEVRVGRLEDRVDSSAEDDAGAN